MKVLVAGGAGLLGSTLVPILRKMGCQVYQHSILSGEYKADFTNLNTAFSLLDLLTPDIIINLICLSSVDRCELEPASAYRLNVTCVENIASWINERGRGTLIQISTDHVYDTFGKNTESDLVIRNTYAMSKRCAELVALRVNGVVLRTNFFGPSNCENRQSFSDWLIEAMEKQSQISLFNDVYFNPLTMETLSELIGGVMLNPVCGVYNLGAHGGMTKRDFGYLLADHLGGDPSSFQEGSVMDTPQRSRPRFMEMNLSLFQKTFGVNLPTLKQEIQKLG